MMKLEQIKVTYVVHSLAGLILLATMALFGYEFSKPRITLVSASSGVRKMSPLSPQVSSQEQIHHLPALSWRYRRKVLVHAVRHRSWRPTEQTQVQAQPQPGNGFELRLPISKAYAAMSQAMFEGASGNP
jgi:hypothetical protein